MVKPIPDDRRSLTSYLIIDGAAEAINFYRQVFDATEVLRMPGPGGRVSHAELSIGDSQLMLADATPDMPGPKSHTSATSGILVFVEDVDATVRKAVASGARVTKPVEDQFYGDRSGSFMDPFGHIWHIATHIEDVSKDELKRRLEGLMGQAAMKQDAGAA